MVDTILNNGEDFCDINGDNELNIVDVVQVINTILYGFNIEMVTIPAGNVLNPGSNEIQAIDYSYQIGKYEVTNQQYLHYLNEAYNSGDIWIGDCIENIGESCVNGNYINNSEIVEKSFFILGNPRSYELKEYYFGIIDWDGNQFLIDDALYLNHPIINVSWYGANHFCIQNGFRLPTYNEWIRSARGESNSAWPFSGTSYSDMHLLFNVLNSQFNLPEGFVHPWDDGTTSVGFYNLENNMIDHSSSFGVYDLIGNSWEWITDPISFNSEFKQSVGGAWDWSLYNSRLKWVKQISMGNPSWSTGFRVIKDLN